MATVTTVMDPSTWWLFRISDRHDFVFDDNVPLFQTWPVWVPTWLVYGLGLVALKVVQL